MDIRIDSMNCSGGDISKLCKQLKNMFDFLLVSIEMNKNVSVSDIHYFLRIMDMIMVKICKKVEK